MDQDYLIPTYTAAAADNTPVVAAVQHHSIANRVIDHKSLQFQTIYHSSSIILLVFDLLLPGYESF